MLKSSRTLCEAIKPDWLFYNLMTAMLIVGIGVLRREETVKVVARCSIAAQLTTSVGEEFCNGGLRSTGREYEGLDADGQIFPGC